MKKSKPIIYRRGVGDEQPESSDEASSDEEEEQQIQQISKPIEMVQDPRLKRLVQAQQNGNKDRRHNREVVNESINGDVN